MRVALSLGLGAVVVVVALLLTFTAGARRRGYGVGGWTIVRCRAGHLFTTLYVPGASLKAVRLGWYRFQRCPVGQHWALAAPVREADLTPEERAEAERNRDRPIP